MKTYQDDYGNSVVASDLGYIDGVSGNAFNPSKVVSADRKDYIAAYNMGNLSYTG